MRKVHDILSKSQLFGGLPEAYLEKVGPIAVHRCFNKDEMLFFDGDEANGFYIVAEGEVNVYKVSPDGKEQILHIVKEGEMIGCVSVFSGELYPANARAISKSHLLFFPGEDFLTIIINNPQLTMNLLAVLSRRLREFAIQIENISLKEIPGRLASYLLSLSEEEGGVDCITLNISKQHLAGILGTGPESLSRALGTMKIRKLIEEEDGTIRIIDRRALEELAENGKHSG